MSALSDLQHHLTRYWALLCHQDAELNTKLDAVQAWQRARIQRSHSALFEQPKINPWQNIFSLNYMVVMNSSNWPNS